MQKTDSSFRIQVTNHISKYTKPTWIDSIFHFTVTLSSILFLLSCSSIWLAPLLALVFVRTFIVFHDLAHNSFFPSSLMNWIGGLIFGTIVFTPHSYWSREHGY